MCNCRGILEVSFPTLPSIFVAVSRFVSPQANTRTVSDFCLQKNTRNLQPTELSIETRTCLSSRIKKRSVFFPIDLRCPIPKPEFQSWAKEQNDAQVFFFAAAFIFGVGETEAKASKFSPGVYTNSMGFWTEAFNKNPLPKEQQRQVLQWDHFQSLWLLGLWFFLWAWPFWWEDHSHFMNLPLKQPFNIWVPPNHQF